MSSIKQNLNNIKYSLPEHVTLVAVSKTKPITDIMEAYNTGQRIFGENYVQELVEKHSQLPNDIQWHFIGHLQSRKVKLIAPFVNLIHGVDSLKLLQEINKQAKKNNRIIDCLLQVHIADEETKFGLDDSELLEILTRACEQCEAKQLLDSARSDKNEFQNIKIIGLMGMATFTNDKNQIKKEFLHLKSIFDKYERHFDSAQCDNIDFKTLSMGMSGDYQLAIECGSTMVRVGSSIFGSRK